MRTAIRTSVAIGTLCVPFWAAGCGSILAGGGVGWDAGTLGVSGVETGFGGFAEVIAHREAAGEGFGLGPSLQIAGFQASGDADPIAFTTLEARYRGRIGSPQATQLYWAAGTGLGAAWMPSVQRMSVPLHGEIGLQHRAGNWLFGIGARERFLGLIGTGSPPVDAFNSIQIAPFIGWGGGV